MYRVAGLILHQYLCGLWRQHKAAEGNYNDVWDRILFDIMAGVIV